MPDTDAYTDDHCYSQVPEATYLVWLDCGGLLARAGVALNPNPNIHPNPTQEFCALEKKWEELQEMLSKYHPEEGNLSMSRR